MLRIGLTGSIGMGKSETAKLFAAHGWPSFDADAAVHRLYGKGGAAVPLLERRFPGVTDNGAVDRQRLSRLVLDDRAALASLEAIVHPLVHAEQEAFARSAEASGAEAAMFDIPLLYEKSRQSEFDAIVVVTAPPDVQRDRVLARPGMTLAKLDAILNAQLPDSDKCRRADFVVDTADGREAAAQQVEHIVRMLRRHFGLRP